MAEPLDAEAHAVPGLGRDQLVLVDGRTFAISDAAGNMVAPTHGLVHDDLRHVSRFTISLPEADLDLLASHAPNPLSSVVVSRVHAASAGTAIVTQRRWVAGGLREDVHVHNTSPRPQQWRVRAHLAADFAHVFDVKQGLGAPAGTFAAHDGGWQINAPGGDAATLVRAEPAPAVVDLDSGTFTWDVTVAPRTDAVISVTVQPVVDSEPADLLFPLGSTPAEALPMRRHAEWGADVARVTSTDPRLAIAVDRALADIAALRIIDVGHSERPVVAAGAPWFMTLFGRDSLLTSWMTLPFDAGLAGGVLATLAELRGRTYDDVAEEQPGRILHELRRHGGGGPFSTRRRYYGTVDATPLFVMLAAETRRWGALTDAQLHELAPAIGDALRWIFTYGDSNGDGFVDYARRNPQGLSNQGWKDSWDGVPFADGSFPDAPIALAEVQGYVYAALLGAAELSTVIDLPVSAGQLVERAARLKQAFNERFWDPRGWYAVALDGAGRRVDALTTNPGHALWTGIADPELASAQLDRFTEPAMWTGWGVRTLAETMDAYDPLSYHNGSVWPHDTALCAAGAARYNRWDVVDLIVNGALDAATAFDGRPPELFAGISRAEAPMPVAYPASCSPQAWASASVLLLVRTLLDLQPDPAAGVLQVCRPNFDMVTDLVLERVEYAGQRFDVEVTGGRCQVRPSAS